MVYFEANELVMFQTKPGGKSASWESAAILRATKLPCSDGFTTQQLKIIQVLMVALSKLDVIANKE